MKYQAKWKIKTVYNSEKYQSRKEFSLFLPLYLSISLLFFLFSLCTIHIIILYRNSKLNVIKGENNMTKQSWWRQQEAAPAC